MDAYQRINDVLVNLFREIWEQEGNAILSGEFEDLTNNDMHVIEAVGLEDDNTMSSVAKKLGVTAGTLTTSVNALVNKKYALRIRSEVDRRVVYIRLTEKGVRAYKHHADFHVQMTKAILSSLSEDEIPVLVKALDGLSEFFRGYKKEND